MSLNVDWCGGEVGKRHVLKTERRANWIPNEGSYQLWATCKNCKFSDWLALTSATVHSEAAPQP